MIWYVIFQDDSPDDGTTPGRLCVSNKEFRRWEEARDYALSISPSRNPRIVFEVGAQLERCMEV